MVESAHVRHDKFEPVAFVHQTWRADRSELAPIRSEVHRWLAPLGLTEDGEWDIVFAVNEAVTNAVEHAYAVATERDTVELSFWIEAGAMCIEIVDHGKWRMPDSPELTGCGRGIEVMQRVIESVLIRYDNRGTDVLLRHPLPDQGQALDRSTWGSDVVFDQLAQ